MLPVLPRASLLLPVCFAAAQPAAQAPPPAEPGVVARYVDEGEPGVVSRDDLAGVLYERFGHGDFGREALRFLVDLELIRGAAAAAGLTPSPRETQAWIEALRQKLRAAGVDLVELQREKGMSPSDFAEFAAVQLAHERLVRRALELDDDEEVTASMLNLWLEEARRKEDVVTDPSALQPGVVATVGEGSLTALDLGRVLVRTVDRDVREKYIRQIVLARRLASRAAAHKLDVTDDEITAEIEARRRQAEANPSYRGVAFDDLLEAQGLSVAELRRSEVLRAQLHERKLLAHLLPDDELDRQLAADRAAVLDRHGARRRLQVILLRAPAGDEQRRAAALARAEEVRQRIDEGMPFAEAARAFSDDPYTKVAGGDAGWHHRRGSSLPDAVADAAFSLSIQGVSQPIETDAGYYLVQVTAVEDAPNDATLKFRLRQSYAMAMREELLATASIRLSEPEPGR